MPRWRMRWCAPAWAAAVLAWAAVVLALPSAAAAASGWSQPVSADVDGSLVSVSCASPTFCAAVDDVGDAVLFQDGRWGAPDDINGTAAFGSVSCPSSAFCAAVSLDGSAFLYTNGGWSSSGEIDAGNGIVAVSCPSSAFCVAGDNAGNVITYDGHSWSVPDNIDPAASITSVSCVSSAFCVAVDNLGNALIYSGGSWSSSDIDASNQLRSVSCDSTSFCMATDAAGNALQFNGTSWSGPSNVDAANSINSVSCPATGFCAAVDGVGNDQGGDALTYSGSWSPAARIDTTGLNGVSCVSASFCVAVDDGGQAFTYPASTPPAAPTLSRFAVFPPTFASGSLSLFGASYQLSETASVRLVLERRVGGRYVAFTGSGFNPPPQAGGPAAGEASVTIDGGDIAALTGGRFDTVAKLPAGSYRLEAIATAQGVTGPAAFAPFRVVAPKRVLLVAQPLKVTGGGTLHATASSCGQAGERFTWGGASGSRGLGAHFGGKLGSSVLLAFDIHGTYEKSWRQCHPSPAEPQSFNNGSCGPDKVTWVMSLDLRALPDVRLVGVAKKPSSCQGHTGDPSGKLMFPFYDSSHGTISGAGNKLKCKKKRGRIDDCTIKPGSTLHISGASTSAMCQTRFDIFVAVRCQPGQLSSWKWRDRESWRLTIRAGAPKCYSVLGKTEKKVRCPKRL